MRIEGRDLKPYIETVAPEDLVEGQVYFSVSYVDDQMHMPILLSLVFVGKNLKPEDKDEFYFQDLRSYAAGVRYDTASPENPASLHTGDIVHSIQYYDQALDDLIRCSLRRKEAERKAVKNSDR